MKKFFKKVSLRSAVLKDLGLFLWENKMWWMMPIVIVFVLLGIIICFAQSSAVVPFIYALF